MPGAIVGTGDMGMMEGMNIHKSQLNLDVNRRYLYRNLWVILIRSHMCVLDISFPLTLNGPKYVVASPTSTIVSGGRDYFP